MAAKLTRPRAGPRRALLLVVAAGAITLAGCGAPAGGSSASPVPAALQAPAAFDPCRDVDDRTVRAAGFNPATREPRPASGEYTAACEYTSPEMSLIVSTSATSFEAFRDRYEGVREGLDIGPRPAVIVRRPEQDQPCELAMKTAGGIITLQTVVSVSARQWGMDRCGGIVAIATDIEPSIGSR
jgi:hypothetical protein